jgi:DNA-binding response OmpR family regulator
MVTAADGVDARVAALEAGADDYPAKPVGDESLRDTRPNPAKRIEARVRIGVYW